MTSVRRCSGLSDSPRTCNDLQFAGLLGLIAIEKCLNISLLIFETCCDCQKNIAQNANKFRFPIAPPGLRPVAARVAAPHHPSLVGPVTAPSFYPVAGPVAAPSFYPTPGAFRPTTTYPSAKQQNSTNNS